MLLATSFTYNFRQRNNNNYYFCTMQLRKEDRTLSDILVVRLYNDDAVAEAGAVAEADGALPISVSSRGLFGVCLWPCDSRPTTRTAFDRSPPPSGYAPGTSSTSISIIYHTIYHVLLLGSKSYRSSCRYPSKWIKSHLQFSTGCRHICTVM